MSFAIMALALLAISQGSAAADGPLPADGFFEKAEAVAPGVWVIRQEKAFHLQPIGNVGVIEQSDGLVLVDSGGSPGSGRRIAAIVRSISNKPVKAVVITHWHGDHTLGLSAIKTAWPGLEVISQAKTHEALAGRPMDFYAKGAPDPVRSGEFAKRLDGIDEYLSAQAADAGLPQSERDGFAGTAREFRRYRQDTRDLFVVLPSRIFTDRLALSDRAAPVELLHPGRGNTEGDAAVWLPKQRILFTGDLVIAPVPFGFNAYPAEWSATLKDLRARDFRLLVPGHGSPERDRVYLDRLIDLIAHVRAQIGPMATQGLTLEQVRAKVDLTADEAAFAGADPWLRKWFKSYWIDPFVEAAWKEAKGVPIEQGAG
jgi:glyoxylase-like metal-dependent hydrolase (beta-lactamase superfamily II)